MRKLNTGVSIVHVVSIDLIQQYSLLQYHVTETSYTNDQRRRIRKLQKMYASVLNVSMLNILLSALGTLASKTSKFTLFKILLRSQCKLFTKCLHLNKNYKKMHYVQGNKL